MYSAGQCFSGSPVHLADPYSGYDAIDTPLDLGYQTGVTVYGQSYAQEKAPFPWLWIVAGIAALLILSPDD